jgi:NitT/TauT family transport system substrate-binding protein
MFRRDLMRSLAAAGAGAMIPVELRAQSARAVTWVGPSVLTPLQTYVLIAIDKGFFTAAGLNLSATPSPGTANVLTQLSAGQGQFGQSAAIVTVPAIVEQGAGIMTIAQPIYRSVFEIASSPSNPIRHPRDMVGKTIGVMSIGGSTDRLIDAMLIREGLDPRSVERVVTGQAAGAFTFLQRGRVAGFWSFYPIRVALDSMGVNLHYLNSDDFAPLPADSVICSRRLTDSEEGRVLIRAYLTGVKRGLDFLLDPANTDECIRILGRYNPTEAEDRAAAAAKFRLVRQLAQPPAGVTSLYCHLESWESGIALMRQMGMISRTVPVSEVATNRFLQEARI